MSRVYLVEDNPIIRESLTATLAELAGTVTVASSTTESEAIAWFAANSNGWDLAVVDLFLSKGSGFGVLAFLQGRSERQSVVVLSNYVSKEVREKCRNLGADAVFDKSTELDGLLNLCQSLARS